MDIEELLELAKTNPQEFRRLEIKRQYDEHEKWYQETRDKVRSLMWEGWLDREIALPILDRLDENYRLRLKTVYKAAVDYGLVENGAPYEFDEIVHILRF